MIKCWNCSTELETPVSSAENSNHITAQYISEVLQSNMFDAQRGGTIVVNINDTIDEIAEILEEHINKDKHESTN
jgi:hypothetical protein